VKNLARIDILLIEKEIRMKKNNALDIMYLSAKKYLKFEKNNSTSGGKKINNNKKNNFCLSSLNKIKTDLRNKKSKISRLANRFATDA
jgi:hypothetical protein